MDVQGRSSELSVFKLLSIRQLYPTVSTASFTNQVYTHLYKNATWPDTQILKHEPESVYGAVFNIEFSPVDDIALTVCSNRAIVSYDPRLSTCSKPLHIVRNAHDDGVNCLTFLDAFSVATCSDDKTIRIWDLRNFRHSVAVLQGHENWVKNVEYDRRSGNLFSIAFHDGVRLWDINKLSEYTTEKCENLVFKMADPVRMRLSPDGSKMFVSGRNNICLVVDSLDGNSIDNVSDDIESLLHRPGRPLDRRLVERLTGLKSNRPSMHIMSGLQRRDSCRSVMSAVIFPSGDFVGLRHIDVKGSHFHAENLTIYDLRELPETGYRPVYNARQCQERYLMYIDEDSPEESLEFIKEISLSMDGRILASPYGTGVRLLAVEPKAVPVETFFDDRYHSPFKAMCSQDLEVLQSIDGHKRAVLTCKFANNDLLLGTGCMDGHVVFHKPRLG